MVTQPVHGTAECGFTHKGAFRCRNLLHCHHGVLIVESEVYRIAPGAANSIITYIKPSLCSSEYLEYQDVLAHMTALCFQEFDMGRKKLLQKHPEICSIFLYFTPLV